MKRSQQTNWLVGALSLLAIIGTGVQAQPGARPGPGGGRNRPQMTPEQRLQRTLTRGEARLRQRITAAGIAPDMQDPIVEAWKARTTAHAAITQKINEIRNGLRGQQAGGKPATDDELGIMVKELQDLQAQEKTRSEQAATDLEGKIHFSQNPRVHAFILARNIL